MKKQIAVHFLFLAAFLLLISLLRNWLEFTYINFWIGGIIGTILPDLDRLVYVYILRPGEDSSKKASALLSQGATAESLDMMVKIEEDKELIFHTILFQVVFLVFAFFIVTSTGSLLGRGIVLAFLLHILIDQTVLLMEKGNFDSWFRKVSFQLDKEQKRFYYILNVLALLIFGFLL